MPRYRVMIEYDGSGFVGWQLQANGLSIQESVEVAIERFSGESVRVYAAGRTDAGVHALGQIAHFSLERDAPPETVRDAVNHHLKPAPIAILEAARVSDDFDARLNALRRSYVYRIVNRRPPLALDVNRAWHVVPRLDADAMDAAAQMVIGRHDFTTFRAVACQARSPVKTLDLLQVRRDGDEVRIVAEARSFLHHQVRNMVGTLKLIGEGRWKPDIMKTALEARDRAAGGPTAPPDGLYLVRVDY